MGSVACYNRLEDSGVIPGDDRSLLLGSKALRAHQSIVSPRSSLLSLLSALIHRIQDSISPSNPSSSSLSTKAVSCDINNNKNNKKLSAAAVAARRNNAAKSRQARSLERNHRHLVDIDSSCRYSREVGSTQVSVDLTSGPQGPTSSSSSSSSLDLSLRYQPDPTSSKRTPLHPRPPPTQRRNNMIKSSNGGLGNNNNNSSSIVSKPPRGWLHPDILFLQDGINFAVQYIGSLRVNTSMKVLDFNTRSAIAKECIHRVCKSAGREFGDADRSVDPKVSRMLDESPDMDRSGSSFQLTVTSLWLKLSDYDSGKAVFTHIMPNISFASGGDAETSDYVAYVAKDKTHGGTRSCYVIECTGGRAQEVITTIGQAFELRFKEYLKKAPPSNQSGKSSSQQQQPSARQDDVEYYNDLPGKKPPQEPLTEPQSNVSSSSSNNLIDFSTEISPSLRLKPEYINGDVLNGVAGARDERGGPHQDPFDMSPFPALPSPVLPQTLGELTSEPWFHGPISRKESEGRLLKDGDFLVRESQGSLGQYVLTGMMNGSKRHLLLKDPASVVRTKDRSFDSVGHLIKYHLENGLPIISAESTLRLLYPVPRS